ncbi:MAG: MFS transporter, partial [Anaerolineae bacterium]|nr:MFS transporter [Anaerolineae bacterium]
NNNEVIFGSVQSAFAVGGLVGGLVMSVWGGPKRRIHGLLLGLAATGIPLYFLGVGQTLPVWLIAAFSMTAIIPMLNGSSQAIWQAKVPPDVQGRVFATRRLIAMLVSPFARLIAGPLADNVFEPAMQSSGTLAPLFGDLVGTGSGAGIGLMHVICSVFALAVPLGGYLIPIIRNVEDILLDHDTVSVTIPEPVPAD